MSDAHKFTGDERDSESNLDHTQFRQYSSSLGRWMHPDPAGLAAVDPSNPQSWNRYAYVRNNPLALVDPFGLNECAPGEHDCNAGEGEGNPGQDILVGPTALIEFGIDLGNFWDNQSHVGIGGGNFGSLAMLSVFQTYSVETDVTTTETSIDGSLGSDFLTYFLPIPSISGGGSGGGNTIKPSPKITFRPPSIINFVTVFLPCYGGQVLGNFFGDKGKAAATFGTISLTVK